MQLKFKAKGICPDEYAISGETINGIDLSVFPEGGKFTGDESTNEAGIYDVYRDETGELIVTLAQKSTAYEVPVNSHDWVGSETLVDAATFSNNTCYILATNLKVREMLNSGTAEYKKTANGWTVAAKEVKNELV